MCSTCDVNRFNSYKSSRIVEIISIYSTQNKRYIQYIIDKEGRKYKWQH